MPIKVTCPKCQGVLHAPDDAGGKRGKCPTCGTVLAIPANAGPAAEAQPMIPPEPHRSLQETPFKSPAMNRPPAAPAPDAPRGSGMLDDGPGRRSSTFGMAADAAPPHEARRPAPPAPGRTASTPGFGNQNQEQRKPADPFSKPGQAKPVNANTETLARSWRRGKRGLLWVQFGYFLLMVAIIAVFGLVIASNFGVKLPNKTPGFAKQEGVSTITEIYAAAGLIPLVLALLCMTLGRFGAANVPRTSFAKGTLLLSALATLVTVGGLVAYGIMTVEQIRTSQLLPPNMLVADEPVGMIQRGGLVLAAVFGPVAELLFVIGLARIGAGLHNDRLSGRSTRWLMLAAFAFVASSLWIYGHALYGPQIDQFMKQQVQPNIDKAGEHKSIIGPAIAVGASLFLWFVYVRLVGSGRGAIRQWLDEHEPA